LTWQNGENEYQSLLTQLARLAQQVQENEQRSFALNQKLLQQWRDCGLEGPETRADYQPWIEQLRQTLRDHQAKKHRQEQLTHEAELNKQKLNSLEQSLNEALQILNAGGEHLQEREAKLESLQLQRRAVFGDKDAEAELAGLKTALETATEKEQRVRAQADILKQQYESLAGQRSSETRLLAERKQDLYTSESQWRQGLNQSPFSDLSHFEAALLDKQERLSLQEMKQALDTAIQQAAAIKAQTEQKLGQWISHLEQDAYLQNAIELCSDEAFDFSIKGLELPSLEQAGLTETSLLNLEPDVAAERKRAGKAHLERVLLLLQARLKVLNDERSSLQEQGGALKQQLQADQDKHHSQKALFEQIEHQRQVFDDWAYLSDLIGSADGAKFRRFAQGLTLDHLVYLANQQLQRLHARYQLQRKAGEALELQVLDTWQADSVRDTKTLSGGESFLVSLALALALSDLVSHKTSIDSLFLDEGFGTLDRDTLDVALDALDSLNSSGKMIGIISHVDALKERIPVQIAVEKMSGLGTSKLDRQFVFNGPL
jgi:exonuclease SbcC